MDNIVEVKNKVIQNAQRIKELGNWPEHMSLDSLINRIPDPGKEAPGFDAGIACALDLIPRDKQRLSAILHAAYTEEAIKQVRKEIEIINTVIDKYYDDEKEGEEVDCERLFADCTELLELETTWWLLGCSHCVGYESSGSDILFDIAMFSGFINDKFSNSFLINDLKDEIESMKSSFFVVDNIPYATKDGGMQGAYISGYPFAVGAGYGVWFVGTFYDTLGVPDDFPWSDKTDEEGRKCSGPVHGSEQFVKCSDLNELNKIVAIAENYLGKKQQ